MKNDNKTDWNGFWKNSNVFEFVKFKVFKVVAEETQKTTNSVQQLPDTFKFLKIAIRYKKQINSETFQKTS